MYLLPEISHRYPKWRHMWSRRRRYIFQSASCLRSRFTGRISGSFLLGVGRSLGWTPFWKHVLGWEMTGWWWWMKIWYAVINMIYITEIWNIVCAPFQSQQITQKKNRNFCILLNFAHKWNHPQLLQIRKNRGSTSKIGLSFRGHSASWRSKNRVFRWLGIHVQQLPYSFESITWP